MSGCGSRVKRKHMLTLIDAVIKAPNGVWSFECTHENFFPTAP
jgi:hypothetical protein